MNLKKIKLTKTQLVLGLSILLLLVDQAVKIAVKTHMTLDEAIPVFGHWFYIRFIENEGAAYGMTLGGSYGKLMLSLIRVVAIGALFWYIRKLIKRGAPTGVVVGLTVVLVGAFGNLVDSAFYGLVFSESTFTEVARWVPWGEGYAGFLHGSVVDMLYFPIIQIDQMPSWIPFVGGEPYTFFSPIFNIADSYVICGILYLVFFQHKYFNSTGKTKNPKKK